MTDLLRSASDVKRSGVQISPADQEFGGRVPPAPLRSRLALAEAAVLVLLFFVGHLLLPGDGRHMAGSPVRPGFSVV